MSLNKSSALKILGLSSGATTEEIKQAYRKLAMKHHPDRNPGDASAEARFKEAKEAYEYLTSTPSAAGTRKRPSEESMRAAREYDEWMQYFQHLDDFDEMHKGDGASIFRSEIRLTLNEAFAGKMLHLKFAGTSDLVTYVKVNPGVVNGQRIKKVLTKDSFGKNIQIDVHVVIECGDNVVTWATDPNLYSGGVEGSGNIEIPFSVSWADIVLGRFVRYNGFDGESCDVRILPGIEAGRRIKLQGRGYWKDTNCTVRGDVFLKIIPQIPKLADIDISDIDAIVAAHSALEKTE